MYDNIISTDTIYIFSCILVRFFFFFFFFFFNDTATTEIYTLSLHDALPILFRARPPVRRDRQGAGRPRHDRAGTARRDRKSTRLNSSHSQISYAVFCLKKKKKKKIINKKNTKKQNITSNRQIVILTISI